MDEEYGKLIWARFYSALSNPSERKFRMRVVYTLGPIVLISAGLIILFLATDPMIQVSGIFGIVLGGAFPFIFYFRVQNQRKKNRYMDMVLKGELDWDIYENGILMKYYHGDQPGAKTTKFLRFDDLSKVYFNIGPKNGSEIKDLILATARRKSWEEAEITIALYSFQKSGTQSVLLVDKNGDLMAFNPIEKVRVADLRRFESVLRQKVKTVE